MMKNEPKSDPGRMLSDHSAGEGDQGMTKWNGWASLTVHFVGMRPFLHLFLELSACLFVPLCEIYHLGFGAMLLNRSLSLTIALLSEVNPDDHLLAQCVDDDRRPDTTLAAATTSLSGRKSSLSNSALEFVFVS
jgi:hypothetical protein